MSKKFNILLLNGPNLNMLGAREPKHYGSLSLSAIEENVGKLAAQHDVNLECFQANSEEKLINKPSSLYAYQCCIARCVASGVNSFC